MKIPPLDYDKLLELAEFEGDLWTPYLSCFVGIGHLTPA